MDGITYDIFVKVSIKTPLFLTKIQVIHYWWMIIRTTYDANATFDYIWKYHCWRAQWETWSWVKISLHERFLFNVLILERKNGKCFTSRKKHLAFPHWNTSEVIGKDQSYRIYLCVNVLLILMNFMNKCKMSLEKLYSIAQAARRENRMWVI